MKKHNFECIHSKLRKRDDTFLKCKRCRKNQKYCENCNIPICNNCFDIVPLPIPNGFLRGEETCKERYEHNLSVFGKWYPKMMETSKFKELKRRGWWVGFWTESGKEKFGFASDHYKILTKSPADSVRTKIGESSKVILVSSICFLYNF